MATTAPISTNPVDFLLDSSGDLVVDTDLHLSSGLAAVGQSCRIALQFYLGEWFLNLGVGIPYWQSLLGSSSSTAIKAAQISFAAALAAVDGVNEVTKLQITFDGPTRLLTVTFQVSTALGLTPQDSLTLSATGAISTTVGS